MIKNSHLFLAVLVLLTIFSAVSCKSTENTTDDADVTDTSGNVAPHIPSNTSRSPSVTDINPSLPLIDHIRRLSGVQVAGRGMQYQVRVRGASYLRGNNNPLFVVDGIPFGYSYEDVASSVSMYSVSAVRLVRGSELTRRFGSRGSTGVIEIITRQSSAAY